ncbi:MAG TPA: carbamoyl phosphate synthase large subunit, partial [Spongiibacteraceae bacterium]|nr:carbamoyl phosphate synthase large subunit [Spongiibacteraceae bacterium]
LGPEMKSTGEVMGVGDTFAEAYAKAQLGAGEKLPRGGKAFLSVREQDKPAVAAVAADLIALGFTLCATRGTQRILAAAGLECQSINKVNEGRPHIVDMVKNGEIELIVNTTEGKQAIADSSTIRRSALTHKVFYSTTLAGAEAVVLALRYGEEKAVRPLQTMHRRFDA